MKLKKLKDRLTPDELRKREEKRRRRRMERAGRETRRHIEQRTRREWVEAVGQNTYMGNRRRIKLEDAISVILSGRRKGMTNV